MHSMELHTKIPVHLLIKFKATEAPVTGVVLKLMYHKKDWYQEVAAEKPIANALSINCLHFLGDIC